MTARSNTRSCGTALRTAAAVAAAGAGLALALAPAAQAAPSAPAGSDGPYLTLASPSLNERSAPSTSASVVGSLPYHSTIYISCQTSGSNVDGSVIWDRLTGGQYISDYWTNTPGDKTWTPSIPRCSTTPPPPPPGRKWGQTVSYNEGTPGQCTWWAINEFHAYTGRYPDFTRSGNDGNAEYWAGNAAYRGWTVTATPELDSVVVFPPGVNGADSVGHVAWVTAVNGSTITFSEMNGTAGPGRVDTRTVHPASSVRYILAP